MNSILPQKTIFLSLLARSGWVLQPSVPAILKRAFASLDRFVHSSGHRWGAFALEDAFRLVVTDSGALSPAQALRERKTAVGFWSFKTDMIAHYFVFIIFSNT